MHFCSDWVLHILTDQGIIIEIAAAILTRSPCFADRVAGVKRKTKETDVSVSINLDGTGVCNSSSQIPFLDHMMDQLASHGLFDVTVQATGDIHIDDHHTNEDIGLALGTALSQALGDRKGINRFGHFVAPLDEAIVQVTLVSPMPLANSLTIDGLPTVCLLLGRCPGNPHRISRGGRTSAATWTSRRSESAPTTPSWWSTFSSPWSTPRA